MYRVLKGWSAVKAIHTHECHLLLQQPHFHSSVVIAHGDVGVEQSVPFRMPWVWVLTRRGVDVCDADHRMVIRR